MHSRKYKEKEKKRKEKRKKHKIFFYLCQIKKLNKTN